MQPAVTKLCWKVLDMLWASLSLCSTTAVRRMGLTAPPSLSNTLPAMPAVSPAWTGRSSPHCPCPHRSLLDPPTRPNPQGGNAVTAPPARPMTRPSTSVPLMRCATVVSASPTCPHTMRTRRWRCRCPPSEAPCWGRPREDGLPNFTPTPEPSAPRCDHHKNPPPIHRDAPLLTSHFSLSLSLSHTHTQKHHH